MGDTLNPFAHEVCHYNDQKLAKILKYPLNYTPQLVEACKQEFTIRNNQDDLRLTKVNDSPTDGEYSHLSVVRGILSNGGDLEKCRTYLVDAGLEKDAILEILDQAARTAPLQPINVAKETKKGSKNSIWMVLFSIYVLFKVIRLLTQ